MQYSFDLRRKLIEAWQSWDGTQAELAELLGVSRSWWQKVLRRWEQSGDGAAPVHRHGPVSRLPEQRLAALVAAHPDATVAELGRRLKLSASTVCRALQRMNLPRKKDTPRQRTGYAAGPAVAGALADSVRSPTAASTHLLR
jgi:transposase